MDIHYKTKSFYLVTSLPIYLKCITTCCANYPFNETIFPPLGGEESVIEERREIIWNALTLTHLDPHTNQCELEVRRIIHLQNLANQLQDAFIDIKKMTKSYIPAANTPIWIDVPIGQLTNESKIRLKRGRTVDSNYVTSRKRKT